MISAALLVWLLGLDWLFVPGSLCLWCWFWVLYCDVYVVVAVWRFVILVYGLVYSGGFVGMICGGCFLVI